MLRRALPVLACRANSSTADERTLIQSAVSLDSIMGTSSSLDLKTSSLSDMSLPFNSRCLANTYSAGTRPPSSFLRIFPTLPRKACKGRAHRLLYTPCSYPCAAAIYPLPCSHHRFPRCQVHVTEVRILHMYFLFSAPKGFFCS
jgi:hypothetical protein